jgi:hypothetical protein
MMAPVKNQYKRLGKKVYLSMDLPTGFGNSRTVRRSTSGYVLTNGFENGIIKVKFNLPDASEVPAFFNPDAALKYLECDPWY